jgi:uncharacterized cupredoxin-like copper-binding protein
MERTSARIAVAAIAVVLVAGLTACGGDEGSTVEVTLQEFAVLPSVASTGAGSVTFEATNDGPNDPHELVVIRTDLDVNALPTTPEGAVDEAGEGIEVIGEIEEFDPGTTESATFELEAGSYALVCNIVEEEEGETEAHYSLGMRASFTVE